MTSAKKKTLLLSYVPVIHQGYIELIDDVGADEVGIYADDVIKKFDYLRKDVRALEPQKAVRLVKSGLGINARLFSLNELKCVASKSELQIVMPDDDISRQIGSQLFSADEIQYRPVFLRWDRDNSAVNVEVDPHHTIEQDEVSEEIINTILNQASHSSDWWRQVGAAITKDGEILASTRNQHLPTEYTNWIDGDPRNAAKRGQSIDAATAQHAEAKLVAKAAKEGTKTDGTDIYVTTFPCPTCAKIIASSGIKRCYYLGGYAMTDGQTVLEQYSVKIIKINAKQTIKHSSKARPYPKKQNS